MNKRFSPEHNRDAQINVSIPKFMCEASTKRAHRAGASISHIVSQASCKAYKELRPEQ